MLISDFLQAYQLHDSLITGWNWAASNRLVLEVDLASYDQEDYTEDMDEIREIVLIFEGCTLVDELNEGFNGFSGGDASIFDAEVKESVLPTAGQGMELSMQHDNYDGKGQKFILITIFADAVVVIDPKRPA